MYMYETISDWKCTRLHGFFEEKEVRRKSKYFWMFESKREKKHAHEVKEKDLNQGQELEKETDEHTGESKLSDETVEKEKLRLHLTKRKGASFAKKGG